MGVPGCRAETIAGPETPPWALPLTPSFPGHLSGLQPVSMLQNGVQGGVWGAGQRSEGENLLGAETVIRKGSCGLGISSQFSRIVRTGKGWAWAGEVGVQRGVSAES